MTVRIEWMEASQTSMEIIRDGEEWIGAEDQTAPLCLAISADEVTAIEGDEASLTALLLRGLRQLPGKTSIILQGNPADGFTAYGPFEDGEAAVDWASVNASPDEPWFTMPLSAS